MYPINTSVFTQQPSYVPPIHRALVTYSNSATGEVQVKIPAIFGTDTSVSISFIGRSPLNGVWKVPAVNTQIIVASDDPHFSNVFWLQLGGSNA